MANETWKWIESWRREKSPDVQLSHETKSIFLRNFKKKKPLMEAVRLKSGVLYMINLFASAWVFQIGQERKKNKLVFFLLFDKPVCVFVWVFQIGQVREVKYFFFLLFPFWNWMYKDYGHMLKCLAICVVNGILSNCASWRVLSMQKELMVIGYHSQSLNAYNKMKKLRRANVLNSDNMFWLP